MFRITAVSKYLNLNGTLRLYYVLAIGGFVTVMAFAISADLLVALTIAACTVVIYLLLSKEPKTIQIQIQEDGISLAEDFIPWEKCVAWAVVELDNAVLEFVIQTTEFTQTHRYFYVQSNQPGVKELIEKLSTFIKYRQEVPTANQAHNWLRRIGLM